MTPYTGDDFLFLSPLALFRGGFCPHPIGHAKARMSRLSLRSGQDVELIKMTAEGPNGHAKALMAKQGREAGKIRPRKMPEKETKAGQGARFLVLFCASKKYKQRAARTLPHSSTHALLYASRNSRHMVLVPPSELTTAATSTLMGNIIKPVNTPRPWGSAASFGPYLSS